MDGGHSSLFTREFFETARQRLAPGGILCQWAHTYDISDADLRSIVATFLSVFPDGTLWMVGDADILLVGSTEPLGPRLSGMASAWTVPAWPRTSPRWARPRPLALLSLFVAEGDTLVSGRPAVSSRPTAGRASSSRGRGASSGSLKATTAGCCGIWPRASPRPPAVRAAIEAADAAACATSPSCSFAPTASSRHSISRARRRTRPRDAAALDGLVRASAPPAEATRQGRPDPSAADPGTRPPGSPCRACWPPRARSTRARASPSACCRPCRGIAPPSSIWRRS